MPVAAGIVGDLGMAACCVLAARDVAAERRRATALDRIHHLQLREAHMPTVGLTPSRAVIAEDVRDLQNWSSHGRAALRRRRLVTVWLPTPAARWAQARQGTLDLGNQSDRHATVAGCGLELGMSERTRAIMLTFYVIESQSAAERDRLLADDARHSARDKRQCPRP